MKTVQRLVLSVLLLALVWLVLPTSAKAQLGFLALRGGSAAAGAFGQSYAIPAYLKSVNITSHTTTQIKTSPGVLACVVVNTLGGTADKVILYNSYNATAPLASIDTTTSKELCYGAIFSGELVAVTSGSGTAADLTITYR